jgi:hypothetical protein
MSESNTALRNHREPYCWKLFGAWPVPTRSRITDEGSSLLPLLSLVPRSLRRSLLVIAMLSLHSDRISKDGLMMKHQRQCP